MWNFIKYLFSKPSLSGGLLILLAFSSCAERSVALPENDVIDVYADASIQTTKTAFYSDGRMFWKSGDGIGVSVPGCQINSPFANVSGNQFFGSFNKMGVGPSRRSLYAYYPYSADGVSPSDPNTVNMIMPENQKWNKNAVFDTSLDVMVADAGEIDYDESDMPKLEFSFNRHLFSLLKIKYRNTDASLKDKSVFCVLVKSATKVLSGPYSVDISKGSDAEPVFDTEAETSRNYVKMINETYQKLGMGTVTTVYALVPPGVYDAGDLSITIYTEDNDACVSNVKKAMTIQPGTLYELETIDFTKNTKTKNKKTVLCFGDSITTSTVTEQLQSLLGFDDWLVYQAGKTSEVSLQIMSRQGTVPLFVRGGFTIPAHQGTGEYVSVQSGFLTTYHIDRSISETPDNSISVNLEYYTGNTLYCAHTNPFNIKGIECEILSDGPNLKIRRLNDGEVVDCSNDSYVQVVPCAAWKYGAPTLTTVYMGSNGKPSDDLLVGYYSDVKKNLQERNGGFIGIGFHNLYYSDTFRDKMQAALDANYLDLRTSGCENAGRIMKSMDLELSHADSVNISQNIWPASWMGFDSVHPNTTGARAYAYLIYYKMKELGYVD